MTDILLKYNEGEITLEEANKELAELGAGFHLEPITEDERKAKEQREMEEGFFDPAEKGLELKPCYPEKPNMKRNKELAGQVVRQTTKRGVYDVHYNEDGYAYKATRVQF